MKGMNHSILAFCCILLFSLVHMFAKNIRGMIGSSQSKFLSFGGGVAIAYVFIDLLSKLDKNAFLVQESLRGYIPFAEHHVFVMALLGFLLFFAVDRSSKGEGNKKAFTLSIVSYSLFNFLVGYSIVDPYNPEIQPIALFSVAMGLHYFTNDYSLCRSYGDLYDLYGKWWLIANLLLGWLVGSFFVVSPTGIALISAFIGGGVIMNVTRHELPQESPNSLTVFLLSAFFYMTLLLLIG